MSLSKILRGRGGGHRSQVVNPSAPPFLRLTLSHSSGTMHISRPISPLSTRPPTPAFNLLEKIVIACPPKIIAVYAFPYASLHQSKAILLCSLPHNLRQKEHLQHNYQKRPPHTALESQNPQNQELCKSPSNIRIAQVVL